MIQSSRAVVRDVSVRAFSHRNVRKKRRETGIGFEPAEPRLLLASIAGVSYVDINGNGVRDLNEAPLIGAVVYLDTNHNQRQDGNEPAAITDANGAYSFTNLPAGNYLVEEVPPSSWKLTSPNASPSAASLPARGITVPVRTGNYDRGPHQLVARSVPDDPLFSEQWHLYNYGQTGGTPGADADVVPVWDQYQGDGVTIGVVDDGMDITHPDLAPNYDPADSYDFDENDADPSAETFDDHGTAVAGVAAARGNNEIGVSGAAPHAQIAALRLIADQTTDQMEADALNYHDNNIDIYSNSWGPDDDGETLEGPGPLAAAAIRDGITSGRNGKGNIYVWAAGNGYFNDDNTNYDGYANNRYAIAVSAIDHDGISSEYSEPGAPILVAAYSDNIDDNPGIVTTDRQGAEGYSSSDYTTLTGDSSFGGTSSAAPLVSGVIALMLQANPNLTWRDVQAILVNSAKKNDPADPGWSQNGAKHWINYYYGFGAIDAAAAVSIAENWTNLPAETSTTSGTIAVNQAIPDNSVTGRSSSVTINRLMKVEKVEVVFTATHPFRGDLRVVLTSPDGTQSVLADGHEDPNANYSNWTFTTVRDWDEIAKGTWTLKVTDTARGDVGTFNSWRINIYGTDLGPGGYVQIPNSVTNVTGIDFGNLPPPSIHVTSAQFLVDAGNRVSIAFDADVVDLLSADAVQISNAQTGETIPNSNIVLDYNQDTHTAIFTINGLDHAALPDGNYTFDLFASPFGQQDGGLDGNNDGIAGDDFVANFFQLKGDANRDRIVDDADLKIVLGHIGATDATLAQGDLTGDGNVDFLDFQAMELAYGNSLAEPISAAPQFAPAPNGRSTPRAPVGPFRPRQPAILIMPRPLFSTQPIHRRMELLD